MLKTILYQQKWTKQKCGSILTDDKLDYIDAQMETNPRKTLHQLAVESGVSKLSIYWAAKFLKLHPCKIRVM